MNPTARELLDKVKRDPLGGHSGELAARVEKVLALPEADDPDDIGWSSGYNQALRDVLRRLNGEDE